jgi:hypothetical protein
MFKDFDKRLKIEVQRSVNERLRLTEELTKHKVSLNYLKSNVENTATIKVFVCNDLSQAHSKSRSFHIRCNAMRSGSAVVSWLRQ